MRKAVIRLAIVMAASWAAISPTRAEVRILASPGGQVGPFLDLFDRVRESGERVVIDGPCLSACTLVLSTVPNERICVTRRAVLGFHAARSIDRRGRISAEPEASQAVLEHTPRRCATGSAAAADCRHGCCCCADATSPRSIRRADSYMSSIGQLTIQGMPNLSTHMPNPLEKKVLPNGMLMLPPSASALKRRSASAGSSTCSETA